MRRPAVWITCALAFAGSAGFAHASPNGPPPPPPPCQFELSVTRTEAVAATVQSIGCAALAAPYSAVACLQPSDGSMSCVQSLGDDVARIVLPSRPGILYTATGRGCAGWVGLPPAPDCQLLGPNSTTP